MKNKFEISRVKDNKVWRVVVKDEDGIVTDIWETEDFRSLILMLAIRCNVKIKRLTVVE